MSTLCKPLERFPTMFVKDCGYIPVVLTNAAYIIEKNIKTKNLFQTQGNISKVNASLSRLGAPRINKIREDNIHDVIEAMKTFLLRMPEPVLPESVCDALISIPQDNSSVGVYMAVLTNFRKSSPHSFAILLFIMMLLKKISQYSEYNCMDIRKLATVFVLDILKPLKMEDSNEGLILIDRMQRLPYLIMVVENLIRHVEVFKSVNNIKGTAPSPKGSVTSMTKTKTVSPAVCRSSFTETHVLLKKSDVKSHDNRATLPMKGQDFQEIETVFENKRSKRSVSTSLDLLTRATSEPQQANLYMRKMPKRCVTDLAKYNCDSFINVSDTGEDVSLLKITKNVHSSKTESCANPTEICLERQSKITSPSSTNPVGVTNKYYTPAQATSSGDRKPCVPLQVTCSPKHRLVNVGEGNEATHNTYTILNVKANRSVDIKMSSVQEKKKRKSRSICKKLKHEKENNVGNNLGPSSDLTFQPDEEITPWNEGSINSDDASIMVKTIRNPRILTCKTNTSMNGEYDTKDNINSKCFIPSNNVTQMILANSLFRTISSQNNVTAHSNLSDSSTTSTVAQCVHLRLNQPSDVCVQYSSHETTPISKDLIRGVKLNGSIGVNTSPYAEIPVSQLKLEDVRKNCQKLKDNAITKSPVQSSRENKISPRPSTIMSNKTGNMGPIRTSLVNAASSKFIALNPTQLNLIQISSNSNPDKGVTAKGQGCIPRFQISNIQQHLSRPVVPKKVVSSTTRSNLPATLKLRQHKVLKCLKTSSSSQDQKANSHLVRYVQSKGLSVGEWFVDIILICITFFCIFLIFFYHKYCASQSL